MRLTILGDFMAVDGEIDITPRAAKPRTLLALLAVRNGETVNRDALIHEIWGALPPSRALGTIHTYIFEIRRALASANESPGGQILLTKAHGYSFVLDDVDFDFRRFEDLYAAGAELVRDRVCPPREDLVRASRLLTEALSLWRGAPLSNVAWGEQLSRHVMWLEERRKQALELRLHVDIALGRNSELIGELKLLIEQHPFHEGFHEVLMLALARCGRRSEALEVFQLLRQRLTGELGIEPGRSLQRVQQSLLLGDLDVTDRSEPPDLLAARAN